MKKINDLGITEYYTTSKPVKGKLQCFEDFIVMELNDSKSRIKKSFIRDFFFKPKKGFGFVRMELVKKNYSTIKLIRTLQRKFNSKIGYSGLKDKNASTSQFITVQSKSFKKINYNDYFTHSFKNTDKKNYVGNLVGNQFLITVHHSDEEGVLNFLQELKGLNYSLPNFFDKQRFGVQKTNHLVGKYLFEEKYENAYELLKENKFFKNLSGSKDSFQKVDKRFLSLFFHAYQSFLFNNFLSKKLMKGEDIGLIDFTFDNSEVKTFFKGLGLTKKSFNTSLMGGLRGFKRKGFMKLHDFQVLNTKPLIVSFWLEKNCFATNFLRELFKEEVKYV